jgi:hypothetical protein
MQLRHHIFLYVSQDNSMLKYQVTEQIFKTLFPGNFPFSNASTLALGLTHKNFYPMRTEIKQPNLT